MWYNHYIGRDTGWMSGLDPLSFYGTNKVGKKEKWTATTWVNIVGDGVNELRPWRMGSNWLSDNNKNKRIIEEMRNDDFIEGEKYSHDSKLVSIDENDLQENNRIPDEKATFIAEKELNNNSSDERKKLNDEIGEERTFGLAVKTENGEQHESVNSRVQGNTTTGEKKDMDSQSNRNDTAEEIVKQEISSSEVGKNDKHLPIVENISQERTEETPTTIRNRSPEKGEGPLGPPLRKISNNGATIPSGATELPYVLPSGKIIENKIVISVLMLIEELGRNELEVVARTLHEKLQLACIPIMVNPTGPM